MSVNNLKCVFCGILPDEKEVFRCPENHIACLKCKTDNRFLCVKCFQAFIEKVGNPLYETLKEINPQSPAQCLYKNSGCTWRFTKPSQMENHLKECKYRPFKCIGSSLDVWTCSWVGLQEHLTQHFEKSHEIVGQPLPYCTTNHLPFKNNLVYSTLNLVDAFYKNFIFYYTSNSNTRMLYFIIFMIGREEEAHQFYYEFEIKSPAEKYRKIKFIEDCISYSVKAQDVIDEQKCVAISHRAIESHLFQQNIHFRFIIKKKELPAESAAGNQLADSVNNKLKVSASFSSSSSSKKGQVAVNGAKKLTEHTSVPLPLVSSINRKPPQIIIADKSPGSAPTTPEYSSINRQSSTDNALCRGDMTPCLTLSINKQEVVDDNFTNTLGCSSKSLLRNNLIFEQPYKAVDNKIYNQKFPTNSLTKPVLKKV